MLAPGSIWRPKRQCLIVGAVGQVWADSKIAKDTTVAQIGALFGVKGGYAIISCNFALYLWWHLCDDYASKIQLWSERSGPDYFRLFIPSHWPWSFTSKQQFWTGYTPRQI
jgi:hypothetical protein